MWLHSNAVVAELKNLAFVENQSVTRAGALCVVGGAGAQVSGATFFRNRSRVDGSAVHVKPDGATPVVTVTNSVFRENQSGVGANAVMADAPAVIDVGAPSVCRETCAVSVAASGEPIGASSPDAGPGFVHPAVGPWIRSFDAVITSSSSATVQWVAESSKACSLGTASGSVKFDVGPTSSLADGGTFPPILNLVFPEMLTLTCIDAAQRSTRASVRLSQPAHLELREVADTSAPGAWPAASTFQTAFNSTGNPVGGGYGFVPVVRGGDVTVTTAAELSAALAVATPGETVFIPGNAVIDVSNVQFTVPEGVTVASNRGVGDSPGALLFRTDLSQAPVDNYTFVASGFNARFLGLRLKGPWSSEATAAGAATGITGRLGVMEIANCELYHWNRAAVSLETTYADKLHHNFIHHNRDATVPAYRGDGIHVSYSGFTPPPLALVSVIEGNQLELCATEVGGGAQSRSSAIVRHNSIPEHSTTTPNFVRLGDGHLLEMSQNVVGRRTGFTFQTRSAMPQLSMDEFRMVNNWLEQPDIASAFPEYQMPWNITATGNEFSGTWRVHQPTAMLVSDTSTAVIPFTAQLAATGADPDGYPINTWLWDHLRDTEFLATPHGTVDLRFEQPGVFNVKVRARNVYGLLSEAVGTTIFAEPSMPSAMKNRLLAFWEFENAASLGTDSHHFHFDLIPAAAQGQPNPVGTTDAKVGNAAQLSGRNALCTAPGMSKALQLGTESQSIQFWVKAPLTPLGDQLLWGLGARGALGGDPGSELILHNNVADHHFEYLTATGMAPRQSSVFSANVSSTGWDHIVITLDRTMGFSLYVNGVPSMTLPPSFQGANLYYPGSSPLCLGDTNSGFVGKIDQLALWKRVLTPAEVTWLFNAGAGRAYSEL